jgi:hypothetical protein
MNKTLKIISIGEYNIIGSKADDKINSNVISDIDSQTFKEYDKGEITIYNKILQHFKNVFKELKNNKKVLLTDFKCGVKEANQPYRWTYNQIMKGYQYDDNHRKVMFIHQLEKHSIIKIDTIILYYNQFIDLTMNYYFIFGKERQTETSFLKKEKKDILTDLKKDVREYQEDGDYYKSLKRLNSYYKVNGKTDKRLLEVINSEYGKKSKEKSRLNSLLYVLSHKNSFDKEDIKKVKQSVAKEELTKKQIINKIEELEDNINNENLLKLIKKYKLNI